MGIISRLFGRRRIERRAGIVMTNVLGKTPGQLYAEQPELRAVVSYVQDAVASTPLKVYRRVSDTDRRRDRESQAAMLLESPRDGVTTFQLVERIVGDICLYGAALWVVAPASDRSSGWEIVPIPYAWVQDEITADGFEPTAYIVQNPDSGGAPVRIDAKMTVRFMRYTPGGTVHAVSPVESLKRVLAERMSALEYRNAVWRNGGWVSRWISRPVGAQWTPEQRERFAASWKNRFAGKDGTDTGGTPIMEDGMELHDTTLNAREAQFAESTQLTREEVCAAYHINPSLIYHTQTQTYASAKDNARALYSEALMPIMDLVCERINKVLLPMLGADADTYVSFDMSSKLGASFEEQAAVLTSSVGGPWMTADEARARLDMPAMGGHASELIEPLNISYGSEGEPSNALSAKPQAKAAPIRFKTRQKPEAEGTSELNSMLSKFFRRQSKRVLPEIDKAKARGALVKADSPDWWDEKRWNRELADDLEPLFARLTKESGRAAMRDFGMDADAYTAEATEHYVRAMAEGKAKAVNSVTLRQLLFALSLSDDEVDEDVMADTPQGVFDKAADSRAAGTAVAFATACAVWGSAEAVRQATREGKWKRTKTWRHVGSGKNPRKGHVAMDGETVDVDKRFSNGARWPHDLGMSPEESCWCRCQVEFVIEKE
jgi:HK97 family phage portal protein